MRIAKFFMLWMLTCVSLCFSQTQRQSFSGEAAANVDLPERVVAPENQVTIWADFQNARHDGVPVFVVNKTAALVSLENQDGDIYLKLETRDSKGRWTRAQAHEFSWCGNSYSRGALQPGMHIRLMGYQPLSGRKAEVRFTTYSNLTLSSNVGQGLVNDQDIESSRTDRMSLRNVPNVFREVFDSNLQREEVTPSYLAACLGLLHVYGDVPALRQKARQKLDDWRETQSPSDEVSKAFAAFQKVFDAEWPTETSSARLLRHCIEQIQKSERGDAEVRTGLVWKTIGDLAQSQFASGKAEGNPTPNKDWQQATMLAAHFVQGGRKDGMVGASNVLSVSLLVDNFVPGEMLKKILVAESSRLAGIAAAALSRRGDTEQLSEMAMTLSDESQIKVFIALATGGTGRLENNFGGWEGIREPEPGTAEERFWRHVVTTQPLKASAELRFLSPERFEPNIYSQLVREGVKAFWQKEIERSNAALNDFAIDTTPSFSLRLSIDYLARSDVLEDAALFRSLLTYRGYEIQKGERGDGKTRKSVPFTKHYYLVRHAALDALNRLGVAPPDNVMIERDVTNPNNIIEITNGRGR